MKWFDGISEHEQTLGVGDREAWCATVHGVASRWT